MSRGGGGWLKGRVPCPPKPNGRAAPLLTLKWGEDTLKDRAMSWETDAVVQTVRRSKGCLSLPVSGRGVAGFTFK